MQASEARERVLHVAEALFARRGYTAVTIKDIASAAGIHHASLYHHAPQGKSQLFIEVMERVIRRHQQGIADAVERGTTLRDQLRGIADWMLSQPPVDMIRMVYSDVPELDAVAGQHLLMTAYTSILVPIESAVGQAQARGEIQQVDAGNIAGAVFAMIQGAYMLPDAYLARSRRDMVYEMIEVVLAGLRV